MTDKEAPKGHPHPAPESLNAGFNAMDDEEEVKDITWEEKFEITFGIPYKHAVTLAKVPGSTGEHARGVFQFLDSGRPPEAGTTEAESS